MSTPVEQAASANPSSSSTPATRKSNEERAKRIEQYYIRHDKNKKKTYLHFMDEGLSKKTVYHILRRHDLRGDVTFKKPTGRRVSVCTPEMFEKLAVVFKENPELSCREAAKQLGIARTTIFRIMAKMRENNLETYKTIESEPRCPTCHQRIDPTKAEKLKIKRVGRKEAMIEQLDGNEGEEEEEVVVVKNGRTTTTTTISDTQQSSSL